VPLAHGRAYADGLPDARLVVIPAAGHFPYLENPGAFADEVERFVAASPSGTEPALANRATRR